MVASMFVLSAAMVRTGAAQLLGGRLLAGARDGGGRIFHADGARGALSGEGHTACFDGSTVVSAFGRHVSRTTASGESEPPFTAARTVLGLIPGGGYVLALGAGAIGAVPATSSDATSSYPPDQPQSSGAWPTQPSVTMSARRALHASRWPVTVPISVPPVPSFTPARSCASPTACRSCGPVVCRARRCPSASPVRA